MARPAAAAMRAGKMAPAPARPVVLLLPAATGALPADGGEILACNAAPAPKVMEHCGHAYHALVRRRSGLDAAGDADVDGGRAAAAAKGERERAAAKAGNGVGEAGAGDSGGSGDDGDGEGNAGTRLKRMLTKDSDDLYDLMGLGEKRWRATADEIKKAFRKVSLMYHPDKVCHLGPEALADSETHFKAVKKAYEILSDKKKRASYDSIDDVDDSIPSETSLNDENFFAKMVPVFDLNARWSSANRVPSLGDDKTPMAEVNKFYDFWYSFKTWRDFSFDLEYDLDQAECREEKRWMDRQNQKHVKTRKLEEASRIRKLVDVAYKRDPRVRREKDEAKEKKEAAKREKAREREAVAEAEAEIAAAAKEEENKKAAAAKEQRASAKKTKELNRQITRRARQKLRAAVKDVGCIDDEDTSIAVERCCGELPAADIDAVAGRVEAAGGDGTEVLRLLNEALSGDALDAQTKSAPAPAVAVESKPEPKSEPPPLVEWTPDEMKRLTKALAKCPVGTVDRYQKLADFVGGGRTAAECLAMVNAKRAKNVAVASAPRAAARPTVVVAPMGSDFERFERERKKCDTVNKETPMSGSVAQAPERAPVAAAGERPNGTARQANGGSASEKPPNALSFSPKQQAQLEAAMKKHPVSTGASRWSLIAEEVSGRSSEECEKRFKELVAFYKSKKGSK